MQRLECQRHRQVLWLQGSVDWCRLQAVQCIQQAQWQQGWWVTGSQQALPLHDWGLPPGFRLLPAASSRKELGSEQPCLVMDAFTGFSPDALGALAGVVQAGGLLLLLTPKDWPACPDRDYRRLAAWPWQPEELSRHFLARCQKVLENEALATWREGDSQPCFPALGPFESDQKKTSKTLQWGAKTLDQQQLVDFLLKVWQRPQKQPCVVTAHRGRGKSSALGLAAAAWLKQQPHQKLLVTAPTSLACQTLFQQFDQQLDAPLPFMAPDALLQERPEADLLLVDEAAALPVPVLAQLLEAYPACVFATTQQGYEGNGRGFALRFTRHLDQVTPGWQEFVLQEPIRWAVGDPLEALVNRLLLLDTEVPDPPAEVEEVTIQWLDRSELSVNEALLRQVFGLLVLAHYRTTPDDLRQLLDAPGVRLAGMFSGEFPVALAWIQEEGGMDADLAEEIFYGRRRPQGHLLAQSLTFHGGQPQAAQLRSWRIQRILVHPSLQRQGLGTQLLTWIQEQARMKVTPRPDFLGSSFGATPELLPFWLQAGFKPVRLGITRDQASGEHTLQILQGLTSAGQRLEQDLAARFVETLPEQLRRPLKSLPAELVVELLQGGQPSDHSLNAADRRELKAFAEGHRPWAITLTALTRWLLQRLDQPVSDEEKDDLTAWVGLLLQDWSVQQVVSNRGLTGKKQLTAWLRHSFKRLSAS
ncbi:MAG: GNAT family N-acetyltransferase [Marinospirillum sp.]|nr:GNAT family N-acetyltransferase [Marinospirillum sp.]MDR9469143.1 GNAT family N-acetyltransferase [Marinospirillum sp.]